MQKPQIRMSWSFRDGNYQDADAWPELGRRNQVKLSAPRNKCPADDTTNLEEAIARIDFDSTEYPELTETAIRKKHTVPTQKFCDLSHVSSALPISYREERKSEAFKRRKRIDKMYINLGEALQSTKCLRKIHAKATTKVKVNISTSNSSTIVTSVRNSSRDPEVRKIKICISKGKKPSKLKKKILLDRDIKAQINMQKRAVFETQKMEAVSKDVNEINLSALKITSNNDIDEDYVKRMSRLSFYGKSYRSTNEGIISESTVSHRPDVIKKLNGLHIRGNYAQYHPSVRRAPNTTSKHCENLIESDLLDRTFSLAIDEDDKEEAKVFSDNQISLRHSRNFREYCTNTLTPELNKKLNEFLSEITRLQRRHYEKDHNKAKYRRRYYSGLKEVRKQTERSKVKFVVIAPDIEKVVLEGGLDDEVRTLLETCKKCNVVFCFGLRRRKLGHYMHGKGLVCCVGIANYNGTEEIFKEVLMELARARNAFKELQRETDGTIDMSKLRMDDYLLTEGINMLMKILGSADSQNCK